MKKVLLKTNLGEIELELFEQQAPETVKNFLAYAADKFYDGTIFHRVIKNFMVQGGGFTQDFEQKTAKAPIQNEAANRIENKKGTIAMARTNDPHSATCQFFINTADNDFLNFQAPTTQHFGYCVFGKTVKGMDVLDKIEKVKTSGRGYHQDVPVENIVIESVTVL